jgi:hypothetical protein
MHQNISNINLIYFIEMNKTNTSKSTLQGSVGPDSSLKQEYLSSLDDKETIAYNIAKGLMGTLFTLEKSNHYLEWLETRNKP